MSAITRAAAVSPLTHTRARPLDRIEGDQKVTGTARYAYEQRTDEEVTYGFLVQSSVARGRVFDVDAEAALEMPGVLAVIWAENAPKLHGEGELAVLQSSEVAYRGQIVAIVVAERLEDAREAGRRLPIRYGAISHDTLLRSDHPELYTPETVNPSFATDTDQGDVDGAFARAEVRVDVTYGTPWQHNNPMEPHASIAVWESDGSLTVYDSTQGATAARQTIARVFGLDVQQVRVISPHVGGGFGSKGTPRPVVIAATMAARVVGRPVKLAVTRQQMFALTGYRTPTIQRLRLGASADGELSAIAHHVVEQTGKLQEFAEQSAVATRMMYAAANRRTAHRLAALDVPTPSWMRAPGECPGMYALESAIDELAHACGVDPVDLRIRNEPDADPDTGHRFSSRNLVACLREGAERFGWSGRPAPPGSRREGRWLVGYGVAASTYPARRRPSQAVARREPWGYTVQIAAADIGTGARTVLTQIAAEALGVPADEVRVEVGDSDLPAAQLAGGSMGTASWGSAVVKACRALTAGAGTEARADTSPDIEADEPLSRYGFGAQFVEARVNPRTGEIRVPRALGVFACGRIINPKLARSQFIGGMTMGIGMALMEEGILDPAFGDVVNHDLAGYHIPTYADVGDLDAIWVDEDDPHLNPMGAKGIGEIGIVGTAAAVGNAVFNATGCRLRQVPIRLGAVVEALGASGLS
ncbi:MAG TPA: xanthine dehydrogenase family protein molybdopterin-binding subunit [Solirubrobacteraceae bacterium]|nr:xanthine dehydrogenase family protein molybdopterin-binding subunit [Solirubrobacteraceae bacterium]